MSILGSNHCESGTSQHIRSFADDKRNESGKESRIREAAKLHVSSIPVELSSEEFEDFFSTVASPTKVFLSVPSSNKHKYKWGFVEFSTSEEADAVISELNNTPPYYFVINFANMNRNAPNNRQNHFSDNSRRSFEVSSDPRRGVGSGSEFRNSREMTSHPKSRGFNNIYKSNSDFLENIQVTVPENGYRISKAEFCRPERSSDVDDSFDDTESVVNFTTRLVSLGQCKVCRSDALKKCPFCSTTYCSEKCAADDWKNHKQLCKGDVYKSSQKNGEDVRQSASGHRKPNYRMEEESNEREPHNGGYSHNYNNKKDGPSPSDDFRRHRHFHEDNKSKESRSRNEGHNSSNKDDPSPRADQRRNRHSHTDDESKERRSHNDGCSNNYKDGPSPRADQRRNRHSHTDDESKERSRLNTTENFSSESQLSTGSYKDHDTSSNNNLSPLMPLPTGVFTQVIVSHVEEGGCIWVSKMSDLKNACNMQSKLQNYCASESAKKVDRVVPGFHCAALYTESNEWCRAEVISVKPKIKICYIDFGNEDIISINNLRALPRNLSAVPAMAFKIMLSADSSLKKNNIDLSSKLSITPVKVEDNVWIVDLEPTSKDQSTEVRDRESKSKEINRSDVSPLPVSKVENSSMIADEEPSSKKELFEACMDESEPQLTAINSNESEFPFPQNCFTEVIISHVADKFVYWVQDVQKLKEMSTFFTSVHNAAKTAAQVDSSHVKVGHHCAALFEEIWYRAEVMSIDKLIEVRFIDFGNQATCLPGELRNLPDEFTKARPYAFKIVMAPGTSDKYSSLQQFDTVSIKCVSNSASGCWVHVKDEVYSPPTAVVPKAIGSLVSSDTSGGVNTPPIPFDSFDSVVITHVVDVSTFWVQKTSDVKSTMRVTKALAAYCETALGFNSSELIVGTICAVFDEIWYRGKIVSIKPAIKLKLIDYGKEEIYQSSQLRRLPQPLMITPPFAFKINLAPGTPAKYCELNEKDQLSIKLVSKVGDSWLANVKYDSPDVSLTSAKNEIDASDSNTVDLLASVYTLNSPIPVNCFTEVEITHPVDRSVYWVKKKADIQESAVLFVKINELCMEASARDLPQLSPGYLCGALFQDLWFRAEVLSLKPAIKVKFIDYGNEEICSRSDMRALPQVINDVPPFAFKIQLAAGTPEKFYGLSESDTMSIKPISMDKGTWSVQVESEPDKPIIKLVRKTNFPIPEASFTSVIISFAPEPNVYWVFRESDITQLGKIQSELNTHCNSPHCATVSTPTVGSLVSALFEDDWYRGKIITTEPLKVKFIDYGNDEVCSASSLKEIPPRLSSVPQLAFKVKLADGTSKKYIGLTENNILSICPISQDNDCWIVRVEKDTSSSSELSENVTRSIPTESVTHVGNGVSSSASESVSKSNLQTNEQVKSTTSLNGTPVIKNCHPTPEANKSVELEPPIPKNTYSKVIVTYPVNDYCYWVSDVASQEATEEMFEFLDTSCKSYSVPITELKSGIKCAAKFKGVWHRAKVVNVKPLKVRYVDFGNVEETRLSDIMELPPGVKEIKPRAFKIKMVEDVPDKYKGLQADMHIEIKPISREADNSWLVTVPEKDNSDNSNKEKPLLAMEKKISFRQHMTDGSKEVTCSPPLKPAPSVISAETKNAFLPLNEFTEVLVVLKNGAGDYWVTLKSSVASLDEMSNKLGSLKNEKAIPIVGKTYVHFYYDTWCRAKVVGLNPLTVFFIDYGDRGTLKESEIHPLPSEFANTPPYAFRIKMAKGTSEQFLDAKDYSMMKIKPVSRDPEGVYTVQVEGDKLKEVPTGTTKHVEDEEPKVLDGFAHVLDAAVEEGSCDLVVKRVQGRKNFSCSVVLPSHGDQKKCIVNQIKKLHLSTNFREKVGSMVACKDREGELGRGVLLSTGDADSAPRVALLDDAYITDPCELCLLPKALQDIPPAGVTCKLKEDQDYTSVGTVLRCSRLGYKGNNVMCEVDGRGLCMLSPYDPSQELPVLPTVSIKSGIDVTISAVTETSNSIYIQPLTEENAERLQSVTLQTNTCCNHGKGLTEEVKRGDIVGCLFEDGRYYRAQITNIKVGKYKVIFLDFGNTSEVDFKDLQPLTEFLKVEPSCAVQVSLTGVHNVALYPEVKSYLEKYIDDGSLTFTMNFASLSSVVLERKGTCLNDHILEILEACQPVKRLMPESIEYVDWTSVNELNMSILEILPGNIFMVLNSEEPLVHFIESKLTVTLSDYAGTFPSEYSYKPTINELVVACFSEDKKWYRAQCLEERKGCFKVFFLDYGNYDLVTGDNLRPMSVEHLQTPVIARKCKIYGIPDVIRPEVQEKINEMFSINSSHKVYILEETADSIVSVFCPQLKNKVDNKVIPLPAFSLPKVF